MFIAIENWTNNRILQGDGFITSHVSNITLGNFYDIDGESQAISLTHEIDDDGYLRVKNHPYTGSGTITDPFQVTSTEQFLQVGRAGAYNPAYAAWTLDAHYEQTADIDMTGVTDWEPIGDLIDTSTFTGVYNGNYKNIKNLTIICSQYDAQGLFGFIDGGTVKNLGVIDLYFSYNGSGWGGGGIVAYFQNGLVDNCYVTGEIIIGSNASWSSVGGIAGGAADGIVQYCWTDVKISSFASEGAFGGVIGYIYMDSDINNCVALNPSIKSNTNDVGRVVGSVMSPATASNNAAWAYMATDGGSPFATGSGVDNGLSLNTAQLNGDGTIGGRFTTARGWTWEDGKLPGFGTAIEMPDHIVDPIPVTITVSAGSISPLDSLTLSATGLIDGDTVDMLGIGVTSLSFGFSVAGTQLHYNGSTTYSSGFASVQFTVSNPKYTTTTAGSIPIIDGRVSARPIHVSQNNIGAFNTYANTVNGLTQHYLLIEDIILDPPVLPETSNWKPIGYYGTGTNTSNFTGSFDGGRKTITGIVINADGDGGMFGILSGAIIRDLALKDCTISANGYGTGGIAGYIMEGSVIINSSVIGNITGDYGVGGIAGGIFYDSIVQNCFFIGNVSGNEYVGGIAGSIYYATITNCYAAGNVTGSDEVGGIAGSNFHAIAGGFDGSIINNNISLNQNIIVTTNSLPIGRIISRNFNNEAELENNYAWNNMPLIVNGNPITAVSDPNGIHGESIDANEVRTQAAWIKAGFVFNTNPWIWNGDNGLPSLRADNVQLWPAHITRGAINITIQPFGASGLQFTNLGANNTVTISPTSLQTITISNADEYDSIRWLWNGLELSKTATLELSGAGMPFFGNTGSSWINVIVERSGITYSDNFLVRVE